MVIRSTIRLNKACRCASASTSLPCKHVPTTTSHYYSYSTSSIQSTSTSNLKHSTVPPPPPPPLVGTTTTASVEGGSSRINQSHSKALEFTAPLWKDKKWFITRNNNWELWKQKSQTLPSTTSTTTTTLIPPPSPLPSKPSPFQASFVKSVTESNILIQKYVALRESNHFRYLKSLTPVELARLAKGLEVKKLTVVQSLLLDDIKNMMETNQSKDDDEKGILESSLESSRKKEEVVEASFEQVKEKKKEVETKQEEVELVSTLPLYVNPAQELIELIQLGYRGGPLSYSLRVALPKLNSIEVLGELWKSFLLQSSNVQGEGEGGGLSNSPQDLHLAFSFLVYLIKPIRSSDPTELALPPDDYLSLAITVFKHLISTGEISETSVALPEVESTRLLTLQKVFLRTIISASLEEGFHTLAYTTLDSLAILKDSIPTPLVIPIELVESNEIDLKLLEQTLSSHLNALFNERQDSYRPQVGFTTPFHETLLGQTYSLLLTLLPRWSLPISPPVSEEETVLVEVEKEPFQITETIDNLLIRFVDEAAERNRWDLISSIWTCWGDNPQGKGWIMPKRRRKLLRWLAGEAPFNTYTTRGNKVQVEVAKEEEVEVKQIGNPMTQSTRTIFRLKFEELAAATYRNLMKGKDRNEILDWNLQEKSDWLELLTTSRASTPRSRDLARRFATVFIQLGPRGSDKAFVFTSKGLLSLIRTSTPPVDKFNRSDFNTMIVNHFIAGITSPSSNYAPATLPHLVETNGTSNNNNNKNRNVLGHYDLTTLAQAYALMGDLDSVTQVYKKLLEQKMLPDYNDVQLVIKATARFNPLYAQSFLQLAMRIGVVIDLELWKEVMKGLVVYYRMKSQSYGTKLGGIVDQAIKNGINREERLELERFKKELVLTDPNTRLSDSSSIKSLPLILDAIGLGKPSSSSSSHPKGRGEVIESALKPTMKKIQSEQNWFLGMKVYEELIKRVGTLEEEMFQIVMTLLLDARKERFSLSRVPGPKPRTGEEFLFKQNLIQSKIIQFTEHLLLDTTPTILHSKTLAVAIRGTLVLEDSEACFKLLRYKNRLGLKFNIVSVIRIRNGLRRLVGRKEAGEFEEKEGI